MLEIETLNKTYGSRKVLEDLTLSVPDGIVYGLLGANGAGKTTTINIVCNLLQADSGTVRINGNLVSEKTKYLLGIAPQETLIYRQLTCEENLRFFGRLYSLRGTKQTERVQTCLHAVGLADQAKKLAAKLSGGMQRRLSLAIALIHQPKLLILDEPTTGLDIEARFEIWKLIRELQKQGITILLTTHLLDEAERLCDRIGMLKQGKLLTEGSMEQLRKHIPAQEIVLVKTAQENQAISRAQELNFTYRRYGSDLAFWLPRSLELGEIVHLFEGIPLDSISRQPVQLEHIYLEVMQQT